MPKPYLQEKSSDTIKPIAKRIKEFIPFRKDNCPKVKIIEKLDIEHVFF